MSYGAIYVVTNEINGKQYGGQTTKKKPIDRLKGHFNEANKKNKRHPFYDAIRKYKMENFSFRIECFCNSQDELNWMEIEVIRRLNTLHPNGYNLKEGGSRGKHHKETKKIISEKALARFSDPEYLAAYVESCNQPERVAKLSQIITLAHQRPEVKENHIRGILAAWADPINYERRVAAFNKPSTKKKQRQSALESQNRPDTKRKNAAGVHRAWLILEKREHWCECRRRSMADPIIRAKCVEALQTDSAMAAQSAAVTRALAETRWINNGYENRRVVIDNQFPLPDGWSFGKLSGKEISDKSVGRIIG